MMKEAADLGHSVAQHNIQGGLQQAGISIRSDVQPLTAKVYSVMPQSRAMSIEQGRSPGEEPPYMQIARWTLGNRYLTQRRLPELTKGERAQIATVQGAIKRQGVKGKKFIAGAAAAVKKELPQLLNAAAKKIESGFEK